MAPWQLAAMFCAVLAPNDTVTLYEFGATWCPACRAAAPEVKPLVAAGRRVVHVDVDERPDLARKFGVEALPCFILVDGEREVRRAVGLRRSEELARWFDEAPPAEQRHARAPMGDEGAGGFVGPTLGGPRGGAIARSGAAPAIEDAPPFVPGSGGGVPGGGTSGVVAPSGGDAPAFEPSGAAMAPPPPPGVNAGVIEPAARAGAVIDPPPPRELAGLCEALLRASVRLRTKDGTATSTGSGTIIDARAGEALVLTCAHLFRETQGKEPVIVDLVTPGAATGLPGRVVSYDLDSDVALVSFTTRGEVAVAPLATAGRVVRTNEIVVSTGCNHGGEATARVGRILTVNRYLGAANFTVSGRPVQGRSGGGLFTLDGRLIGLCNAADPASDEGIYAGLGALHAEVARAGLTELLAGKLESEFAGLAAAGAAPPVMGSEMPVPVPVDAMPAAFPTPGDEAPAFGAAPAGGGALAPVPGRRMAGAEMTIGAPEAAAALAAAHPEAEVIVLVRVPGAGGEIHAVPRMTPALRQALEVERARMGRAPAGPGAGGAPR